MTAKGQNIATQTKCHRLLKNYKCGKQFSWDGRQRLWQNKSVTNSKTKKETTSTAVGYNLEHCS